MVHSHIHRHGYRHWRLITALGVTIVFLLVEITGGLLSGSLALLADAAHMATDAAALGLALHAALRAEAPANVVHSYGYRRHQTLAAFINGFTLLLLAAWIVIEALQRLLFPQPIDAGFMLGVGVLGLIANVAVFVILHHGDPNVNVRAASAHVLGDLLGSLGAITAALVIYFTGWLAADPLLSILIAALIVRVAYSLLRETGHVLLEGIPPGFDQARLESELPVAVPGIREVHHIHAWALTPDKPFFLTMHATVIETADVDAVLRDAREFVQTAFEIDHVTIQIERSVCPDLNAASRHGNDCSAEESLPQSKPE